MQLKEALTKRNKEFEMLESNNKQLLYLLEKYDAKVTEMQEDIDLKDLKIRLVYFVHISVENTSLSSTVEAK